MECVLCGSKKKIQMHHFSKNIIKPVCIVCHKDIHNHGVGNFIGKKIEKGSQKSFFPLIEKRSVIRQGGSLSLFLSPEWAKHNHIKPRDHVIVIIKEDELSILPLNENIKNFKEKI